ncbi:hypothetical protein ABPG74_001642 [Tetrahymena malaccensis]
MGFTLGSIFEFVVLIMNAFAILDEKRFLRKIGWDKIDNSQPSYDGGVQSVKQQLIMLFYTARNIGVYFLIPCNIICIIGEVLFG